MEEVVRVVVVAIVSFGIGLVGVFLTFAAKELWYSIKYQWTRK